MNFCDIFQAIPYGKITGSLSCFNLLIIAQTDTQLVRQSLLCEARFFAGFF